MKPTQKHLALFMAGSLMLVGGGCGNAQQSQPQQNNGAPQANNNAPKNDGDMMKPPEGAPPAGKMKPSEPTPMTDEQTKEAAAGTADHKPTTLTFHVNGGSFYYTPNVIKVKKGDTVKIVFKNEGGMHNFLLDEFNIKMDPIQTGETKELEFTADKAGTFEYYCGVGRHRTMGQKGQLIVE